MDERARRGMRVAIPRVEVHLVVRYGPPARHGLDVHALGVRRKVYRKTIGGGQRALFAQLPVGANRAVLGISPAAIVGHTVELADLWGESEARRLVERLASARDAGDLCGAAILRAAITERIERAGGLDTHAPIVAAATERLEHETVTVVAEALGLSQRHFRRVFRETVGVSPKTYARLRRFQRALRFARDPSNPDWAAIAADVGYYDQAHLISDFRAIAGKAPRALLAELHSTGG
jgi:AraC-like DNA-binding protein